MSFNLSQIWTHMGPLSKGIAFVLFMMAVSFIGITIERLIAFSRSAKESPCSPCKLASCSKKPSRRADSARDKSQELLAAALCGPIIRPTSTPSRTWVTEACPRSAGRNEASRRQEAVGEELRARQ